MSDRLAEPAPGPCQGRRTGGREQRPSITRAFAGGAPVVVCHEPTSALDASVQASDLDLLAARALSRRIREARLGALRRALRAADAPG